MNGPIFRAVAPPLCAAMLIYSVFVLLRGPDAPGGGFAGGLIAVSALAVYGLATDARALRRALVIDPVVLAGLGLLLGCLAGLLSLAAGAPFLTGLRADIGTGDTAVALSTPLLLDVCVYLVVVGTLSSAALALADRDDGGEGG